MKKNIKRRFNSAFANNDKSRTLRLENLESRDLLSVAPGCEYLVAAADAPVVCESTAAPDANVTIDITAVAPDANETPVADSQAMLTTPTNPCEADKTETSITIAWDAVSDAEGYRFIWKNRLDSEYEVITVDADTTSYEFTDLDNDGIYYWKVQALGDKVEYSNSEYTELQISRPLQVLDTPTPFIADETATSVTIAWEAVPNAEGYRFIWKNRLESEFTVVIVDASTTSYEFTDLVNDGTYYWKVQALGDKEPYVNSAYTELQVTKLQILTTPTDPRTTDVTDSSFKIEWDAVEKASGYRFIWKNRLDSAFTVVTVDSATTSYELTDLVSGGTYYWKVQAVGARHPYSSSAYVDLQVVKLQKAPENAQAPEAVDELFDELVGEDYDLLATNFLV